MRQGTEGNSYCSRIVPRFERRNSETNEWTDWHRRWKAYSGKERAQRPEETQNP